MMERPTWRTPIRRFLRRLRRRTIENTEIRVAYWLSVRLSVYDERPRYNRWLAGLHELFWARACGHDWRDGVRIALICWKPRPPLPAPPVDEKAQQG